LDLALQVQQASSKRLGQIVVEQGLVGEEFVAQCMAEQFGMDFVAATHLRPTAGALSYFTPEMARERMMLPLEFQRGRLLCAIADPVDVRNTDEAAQEIGIPLDFIVTSPSALLLAIAEGYRVPYSVPASYQYNQPSTSSPVPVSSPNCSDPVLESSRVGPSSKPADVQQTEIHQMPLTESGRFFNTIEEGPAYFDPSLFKKSSGSDQSQDFDESIPNVFLHAMESQINDVDANQVAADSQDSLAQSQSNDTGFVQVELQVNANSSGENQPVSEVDSCKGAGDARESKPRKRYKVKLQKDRIFLLAEFSKQMELLVAPEPAKTAKVEKQKKRA